MTRAAALIGASPATLTTDENANIRGGAALLAADARSVNHGDLPAGVGDWYAAVAKYSASSTPDAATQFADDVYGTITAGATRTTDDGQTLTLTAQPGVRPGHRRAVAAAAHTPPRHRERGVPQEPALRLRPGRLRPELRRLRLRQLRPRGPAQQH